MATNHGVKGLDQPTFINRFRAVVPSEGQPQTKVVGTACWIELLLRPNVSLGCAEHWLFRPRGSNRRQGLPVSLPSLCQQGPDLIEGSHDTSPVATSTNNAAVFSNS